MLTKDKAVQYFDKYMYIINYLRVSDLELDYSTETWMAVTMDNAPDRTEEHYTECVVTDEFLRNRYE